MKPIFTLALALIFSFGAKAQTTFAPLGAEWFHHMYYGVFHCSVSGQETFHGKNCSVIMQDAQTSPPPSLGGFAVNDLQTLHTYSSGDTVFVYNTVYSKFTPLYIFNVNDGDTICIPHFHNYGGSPASATDTTFCFRVDSVRMVMYDTALLKTVYTHSYEYQSWTDSVIASYGPDEYGAYAERIGGIRGGIYPNCITCPVPLSESYQLPRGVRCYNDVNYAVKLVPGICGIPTVGIKDLTSENISVFPNPATEQLHINVGSAATVALMAMDGKLLQTQFTANNGDAVMNVANLPAGVYLLTITTQEGIYHKRVLISH